MPTTANPTATAGVLTAVSDRPCLTASIDDEPYPSSDYVNHYATRAALVAAVVPAATAVADARALGPRHPHAWPVITFTTPHDRPCLTVTCAGCGCRPGQNMPDGTGDHLNPHTAAADLTAAGWQTTTDGLWRCSDTACHNGQTIPLI